MKITNEEKQDLFRKFIEGMRVLGFSHESIGEELAQIAYVLYELESKPRG